MAKVAICGQPQQAGKGPPANERWRGDELLKCRPIEENEFAIERGQYRGGVPWWGGGDRAEAERVPVDNDLAFLAAGLGDQPELNGGLTSRVKSILIIVLVALGGGKIIQLG